MKKEFSLRTIFALTRNCTAMFDSEEEYIAKIEEILSFIFGMEISYEKNTYEFLAAKKIASEYIQLTQSEEIINTINTAMCKNEETLFFRPQRPQTCQEWRENSPAADQMIAIDSLDDEYQTYIKEYADTVKNFYSRGLGIVIIEI